MQYAFQFHLHSKHFPRCYGIQNIQRQTAAMTTTTRAPHQMTSPTVTPQNIRRGPSEVTASTTPKIPEVVSSSPQLTVSAASRGKLVFSWFYSFRSFRPKRAEEGWPTELFKGRSAISGPL